jgi:hypothetical protein
LLIVVVVVVDDDDNADVVVVVVGRRGINFKRKYYKVFAAPKDTMVLFMAFDYF